MMKIQDLNWHMTEEHSIYKIKLKLSMIFIAITIIIAACSLVACSSAESGIAYLPSKITHYSSQNDTTTNNVFSYDDAGNLTSLVQERIGGPGTRIDVKTGDVSRYDENVVVDNYNVALDENGFATSVKYWQENKDGGTSPTETEVVVEANEQKQITSINLNPNDTYTGVLHSETSFTYNGTGVIESISEAHGGYTTISDYDDEGWKVSGRMVGGIFGGVSSDNEIIKDASGKVIGVEYKNAAGGKSGLTFDYDKNGNISMIYLDGEKNVEIEYTTIENPSPSAKAFSKLKISSSGPLAWVPFMK